MPPGERAVRTVCDVHPDFYLEHRRRARKLHTCSECRIAIPAGELYAHVTGKWDGYVCTYRFHIECLELLDVIREEQEELCTEFQGAEEYFIDGSMPDRWAAHLEAIRAKYSPEVTL